MDIRAVQGFTSGGDISASKEGYETYMRNLTITREMRLNIGVVARAIYTLSGVVSEVTQSGLAPVEGVLVNEGCKDQISMTDKNGFYSISELYPFSFYPGFSKEGYESESRIVTIDGDTRLDIQLVRR